MIRTGKASDTKDDYISIDLSTSKHKNRVIDIFASENLSGDEREYTIRAQWTAEKFHPSMTMSEKDLIDLSNALNAWVKEIAKRRADL